MGKAIWPTMSPSDIIHALSGWGLQISPEVLSRPTPDFVETVYTACLDQLTGLGAIELADPVQDAISDSQTEYPDLYTGAVSWNILVYHFTRLASAARIDDFSCADISNPVRERVVSQFSALINYIKFAEGFCGAFFEDQKERSLNLVTELDAASRESEEVQKKIDFMKAKIAEDEPKCVALREQNNELRHKMFATKEIQTTVVQEVEQLKAEKSALLNRKEALNGEISSVSDAVSRTRTRIVQSPERIKRTITTMSSTAIEERRTVAMHEGKARELQAKMNALLTIERDIRGCVEQLQNLEKEVDALAESQKELNELDDNLRSKSIERNELASRQERAQKQLSNAKEKLERAQRHAEDKKAAGQKNIDRLQQEYNEMSVDRRDNDKQVEALRSEADALEVKMAEHLKESQAELNELLVEYWALRTRTDVYMETLANKLNMKVSG